MQTSVATNTIEADFVSGTVVDGLFQHALARKLTPSLRRRLADAGLDTEERSPDQVEHARFATWLRTTVESLFPGTSESEAYRQLGRDLVRGFSMTLWGSAIIAVSRMIGPRRTLERMARNADIIATRYRARFDAQTENSFRFWISEGELPETFLAGVIAETATLAGAQDVSAEPVETLDGGWVYEVRWAVKN